MIQLASQSGRPDLVQLILGKGLVAATETMKQILESFDVRSINRILVPEVEELLGLANGQPEQAGPLALPNGSGNIGPQDIGNAQGLAAIQQLIAPANGAGREAFENR
jgi:hypothetical protein